MAVVVDSSVAACWVMPDELSEIANKALSTVSIDGMTVPFLFWYELRNVLLVNERRNRIGADQIDEGLVRIDTIPCEIDTEAVQGELFAIARRYMLTIYDASYLELALRTQSMLATLDRRLAAAATAVNVPLVRL